MEKNIVDERNGLEYELVGDYYIVAGEDEPPARPIGIWGAMRRDYLKIYLQSLYYQLLLSGKLNDHLADIEEQAQDMMWNLTEQMKQAEGVTEDLKRNNQMAWVGAVNSIQARVREIIQHELIYV
ncbi:MAG: TnpV protein [Clostridia bacterium]|nr:TnpV protein [Clostridia bacterium]